MLKVNNKKATSEVLTFLKELKEKQQELKNTKEVYHSSISLYLALKNKIFFKNLLLHPIVLIKRNYNDKNIELTLEELCVLLSKVLEYEFLNEQMLTKEQTTQIIKVHKKLKETIENSTNAAQPL